MKIGGAEITFGPTPTTEGLYLYKNFFGVEIITVRMRPECWHGGVHFEGYLGIVEYNGQPVKNFIKGGFAEIILNDTSI